MRYNALYYLLFFLIVMGAFASMAQNEYGFTVLGGVAFAFGALFMTYLLNTWERRTLEDKFELVSLTGIAWILAMRIFYIHFEFIEWIFGVLTGVLALVYVRKMIGVFQLTAPLNKFLALIFATFYGSITLYIVSMAVVPFAPTLADPLGISAFVLLILFAIAGFMHRNAVLNGEKLSIFSRVAAFKDRSIVLVILFLSFTLYSGLNRMHFLPPIYSENFPPRYFELVRRAESGIEKPVNNKYKYEEFKETYEGFVTRHSADTE